jgi:hypothetical protein
MQKIAEKMQQFAEICKKLQKKYAFFNKFSLPILPKFYRLTHQTPFLTQKQRSLAKITPKFTPKITIFS